MNTTSYIKHNNLTKVYFLVFSILALWALLAFITVHGIIEKQEHFAQLINVSGKQRMYSQRTQLFAYRYLQSQEKKDIETLQKLSIEMQTDHQFLLENIPSNAINDYYYKNPNLSDEVTRYLELIELFILKPNNNNLHLLQNQSTKILPLLNKAVSLYEQESNETITTLKEREWFIFIGTLLTLLLEYIFLIRPANKLIQLNTDELNQTIQEKLDLIDTLFNNTPIPLFFKDINGKYQKVNEAFCNSFGFTHETIIGKSAFDIAPKELAKIYQDKDSELYKTPNVQQIYEAEVFNHEKDANIDVRFYKQVLYNSQHKPIGFIGAVLDISDTKAQLHQLNMLNKELNEISNKDQLTGIPNRRYLEKILHQISNNTFIHACNRLCILMLDIDNFKSINDTYGHDIGDEVLQHFIHTSLLAIRRNDILGRWGGEEFLLICANTTEQQGLIVAQKICDSLRKTPVNIINRSITVSIGVAEAIVGHEDLEHVIKRADEALYFAKQHGKDQAQSFSELPNNKAILELS